MNAMTLVAVPQGGNALDILATRYRAAFDKTKAGREQWIDGTLELAAVMLEARKLIPDHREFSRWLAKHDLQHVTEAERAALNGFAKDPIAARKMMEASTSKVWRTIWEKQPKWTPSKTGGGPLSHNSGSSKRKRRNSIPTVMREDHVPGTRSRAAPPSRHRQHTPVQADPPLARPERKAVKLRGLTREEVDPDFVGTSLEFSTKYGHVNIQTKQQIEHHKNQEQLMAWLGMVSDLDRAARVLAATAVDPETLHQWMSKPAKADKLRAWCGNIERVGESLRNLCAGGGCP